MEVHASRGMRGRGRSWAASGEDPSTTPPELYPLSALTQRRNAGREMRGALDSPTAGPGMSPSPSGAEGPRWSPNCPGRAVPAPVVSVIKAGRKELSW